MTTLLNNTNSDLGIYTVDKDYKFTNERANKYHRKLEYRTITKGQKLNLNNIFINNSDLYSSEDFKPFVPTFTRTVAPMIRMKSWSALRIELSKDRAALLKFFCSVTSYRPLPDMIRAHLSGNCSPEWDPIKKVFSTAKTSKLILGGIGAGKTAFAGAEFTMGVIANPGAWHLMAAPTHDQVTHVNLPHWVKYVEELEQAGYPLASGPWRNVSKEQKLVCGGRVFARTYSKVGNLLGFEFGTAWLDEIETIVKSLDVWDTIDGRIRQGNAQWRQVIGTTTPNGLRNVVAKFHEARIKAHGIKDTTLKNRTLSSWYWSRHTAYDNPYLPSNYLSSLQEHYSQRRWKQEVLAEILRPESIIWSEFSEESHTIKFENFNFKEMIYDLAYDAGDNYPHVLWIAQDAQGRSIVFDEICIDSIPSGKLHEEIMKKCKNLKRDPNMIVCDRAVKREIGWAQNAFPNSHVTKMNSRLEQSVSEGIELVRDRLDPIDGEPKLLFAKHLINCEQQRGIIACMSNYKYKQDNFGVITSIPHKDNIYDHGSDAIRMHQVAIHSRGSNAISLTRRHF